MTECRCIGRPILTARHTAWHELVVAQGGPAGLVNAETLQAARRPVQVERPDRQTRATNYRRLVELAKRAGKHAETPPRRW